MSLVGGLAALAPRRDRCLLWALVRRSAERRRGWIPLLMQSASGLVCGHASKHMPGVRLRVHDVRAIFSIIPAVNQTLTFPLHPVGKGIMNVMASRRRFTEDLTAAGLGLGKPLSAIPIGEASVISSFVQWSDRFREFQSRWSCIPSV